MSQSTKRRGGAVTVEKTVTKKLKVSNGFPARSKSRSVKEVKEVKVVKDVVKEDSFEGFGSGDESVEGGVPLPQSDAQEG